MTLKSSSRPLSSLPSFSPSIFWVPAWPCWDAARPWRCCDEGNVVPLSLEAQPWPVRQLRAHQPQEKPRRHTPVPRWAAGATFSGSAESTLSGSVVVWFRLERLRRIFLEGALGRRVLHGRDDALNECRERAWDRWEGKRSARGLPGWPAEQPVLLNLSGKLPEPSTFSCSFYHSCSGPASAAAAGSMNTL